MTWPLIGLGFILGVTPVPGYAKWVGGLLAGAGVALWVALYDTPPPYIERLRTGADGERRTEKELVPLESEGWCVAHDVRYGRYNIDHVIVGPAGVFLLDSKNYDGDVAIDGDRIVVTPVDRPDAKWSVSVGGWLKRTAWKQSAYVRRHTNHRTWVQSVVVLWSPVEGTVVERDRVVYLQGDHLAEWLRRQPRRLNQDAIQAVADLYRAD